MTGGAGPRVPGARITVVGLGPGAPEHLGEAARTALASADAAYLRTRHHPSAAAFAHLPSFDHHYEGADHFEEVYRRIVDDLVAVAERAPSSGPGVVYAVPGSPLVAERTVTLLRADPRAEVVIVPALSFLDLAWAVLGVDPVADGVQLVDGSRVEVEVAGRPGPFLVAQCWSRAVLSRVKLTLHTDEGQSGVVVLHHLGLPDESLTQVPLHELDRTIEPDHLTSVWVPALGAPVAPAMAQLDELVRTLRERCPWDREQTHESLTRHLIEECYEVLDAIAELGQAERVRDEGAHERAAGHLEEELGDLLFQVFFHARLAAEEGLFTLADVARGVHDKLVGRHPHVFGDVTAETPGAVMANWEVIKAAEKGRSSVTEGIPLALPALLLAAKLQRKAQAIGLSDHDGARAGLERALLALRAEPGSRAVGDLLFAVVAVASEAGIDAEDALRAAALRARDRIVEREQEAAAGA